MASARASLEEKAKEKDRRGTGKEMRIHLENQQGTERFMVAQWLGRVS